LEKQAKKMGISLHLSNLLPISKKIVKKFSIPLLK